MPLKMGLINQKECRPSYNLFNPQFKDSAATEGEDTYIHTHTHICIRASHTHFDSSFAEKELATEVCMHEQYLCRCL